MVRTRNKHLLEPMHAPLRLADTSNLTQVISDLTALESNLVVGLGKSQGASASTLTATMSQLLANYPSDVAVLQSDIVVGLGKGQGASASTLVATTSQLLANTLSDVSVLQSDVVAKFGTNTGASASTITAVGSTYVARVSDTVTNTSDIVVIKDDILNNAKSNITVITSNVDTAISDQAIVQEAGDWVNVSDIKVTISEMTTAFSDALI